MAERSAALREEFHRVLLAAMRVLGKNSSDLLGTQAKKVDSPFPLCESVLVMLEHMFDASRGLDADDARLSAWLRGLLC